MMHLSSSVRVAFGSVAMLLLVACGGSENPFFSVDRNDGEDDVDTSPPPTTSNEQLLFDAASNLTANSFVYDDVTDTIVINNLPFDNVDEDGGEYAIRAGVTLPDGNVVYESPSGPGFFDYFAVLVDSPSGLVLAGAVATGNFAGFGYGGAFARRTSSGLAPEQPASYVYTGDYAGIRITDEGGGNDDVQLVSGDLSLEVDLQDLDAGGSATGFITGRSVVDVDGNALGTLSSLILNVATVDDTNNDMSDGTATIFDSTGAEAQGGTWYGMFAGPAGEEVVGYVIVEGNAADNDLIIGDTGVAVRETGVFQGVR